MDYEKLVADYFLSVEKIFKNKFYRSILIFVQFLLIWYIETNDIKKEYYFLLSIMVFNFIYFFKLKILFILKSNLFLLLCLKYFKFEEVNIILIVKLFLDCISFYCSKSNNYEFKLVIPTLFVIIVKINYLIIISIYLLIFQTIFLFFYQRIISTIIKEKKNDFKEESILIKIWYGIFNPLN